MGKLCVFGPWSIEFCDQIFRLKLHQKGESVSVESGLRDGVEACERQRRKRSELACRHEYSAFLSEERNEGSVHEVRAENVDAEYSLVVFGRNLDEGVEDVYSRKVYDGVDGVRHLSHFLCRCFKARLGSDITQEGDDVLARVIFRRRDIEGENAVAFLCSLQCECSSHASAGTRDNDCLHAVIISHSGGEGRGKNAELNLSGADCICSQNYIEPKSEESFIMSCVTEEKKDE